MAAHSHKRYAHAGRHNVRREESPTRTDGLQDEYRVELERRFRKLRGVIRETVDANDALELRGRQNAADDIDARERFDFPAAQGRQRIRKQTAFRRQLATWLSEGLVEPVGPGEVADGTHWTATYVRAAYRQGIQWAEQQLRDRGEPVPEALDDVFNRPIHTDQIEALYERNFEELQTISSTLDQTLSRALAEGLRDGENPRTIADRLTKETRTVQRRDARRVARSEILFSHNSASMRRYQEHGVDQVEVVTHTPCPICERVEANDPYPADDANPVVPAHPNCVCGLLPVIS